MQLVRFDIKTEMLSTAMLLLTHRIVIIHCHCKPTNAYRKGPDLLRVSPRGAAHVPRVLPQVHLEPGTYSDKLGIRYVQFTWNQVRLVTNLESGTLSSDNNVVDEM